MAKVLRCRDVGMDCDFEAKAESVQEILVHAEKHAKEDHGMEEIPAELLEKVKEAIHDE